MSEMSPPSGDLHRRGFVVRVLLAAHALVAGTFGAILGAAVLAPSFTRRPERWLHAGPAHAVREGDPLAVTLRTTRADGYAQVVDRTVVYLVRRGEEIRALGSTCTHLGCRTSYDRQARRIVCPCHGGAYDLDGHVVAGPPPAPLPEVTTRVEDGQVLVRL